MRAFIPCKAMAREKSNGWIILSTRQPNYYVPNKKKSCFGYIHTCERDKHLISCNNTPQIKK